MPVFREEMLTEEYWEESFTRTEESQAERYNNVISALSSMYREICKLKIKTLNLHKEYDNIADGPEFSDDASTVAIDLFIEKYPPKLIKEINNLRKEIRRLNALNKAARADKQKSTN